MAIEEGLTGELHRLVDAVLESGEVDVAALQREHARLTVALAETLDRWSDGGEWRDTQALTPALAIAKPTHRCHRAAGADLARARKLALMPLTRQAIVDGRLSVDHLDLFCRYATEPRMELFREHEATLVEQCSAFTVFDNAVKLLRYWARLADEVLDAPVRLTEPSRVYVASSRESGEVLLQGVLAAVDGEIVGNELRRLTREITLADRAQGVQRTHAQRRAVALVTMATRSNAATGVSPRPLFQVLIGDHTTARLCELASGTVVSPEELVPYLGVALVESFLFDEDHTVLGASRTRTFTGRLRRAIQARDRHCQHPSGCPTPAVAGDIDHRVPVAVGGVTSQFNGRALCEPHNRRAELRDRASPVDERPITSHDRLLHHFRWRIEHAEQYPDDDGRG